MLFSRLHHGESTVVVGGPNTGKSSLLRYLAAEHVLTEWLGGDTMRIIPVEWDCRLLSDSYHPNDLWRYVLQIISEQSLSRKIKTHLSHVQQSDYSSFTLERFFKLLGQSGRQVVLLIDMLESLLKHPHFKSPEFFGALRALAIKTDGLALIAASRLSIAELNRRTRQITGSPFFNFCIDVPLPPLSPIEMGLLLDTALHHSSITFTADDRHYIQRMSGRHPFLAQVSAAALFEATRRNAHDGDRYMVASGLIQDWARAHFDERWQYLSERAREVLQMLAQAETRTRDGQVPPNAAVHDLDTYTHELRNLEKGHVIEHSPDEEGFLWRGQRWHISAVSFALWIAHNVCALPQVRLEAADKVPAAAHGRVLPTHIIVYGDYIGGDKSTAFDQRGQDVGEQYNAGGDIHNTTHQRAEGSNIAQASDGSEAQCGPG
jgi:hypothetical protein